MSNKTRFSVFFLTTVLAGLLAGFFYTWSFTVLQSLNLIGGSSAASAMISINENIRSGWFAIIFFGTPVLTLLSLLTAFLSKNRSLYLWVCLAFLLAIATLVITFTVHLPLNDELANGADWSAYVGPWVLWNHARLITSLLTFVLMLCVLVLKRDWK